MRSINSLPLKNIVKKPASSFALILISAFLALSAFGGTVMVMSLSGGLDSLSARLGADIIVTPYAATSQVSYDSVIIQGKPGQFYMDSKYYEEIKTEIEGIDKITAQFYLASAKASCCSSRLQIIGFDPATDFSIQPWVEKSYSDKLGLYDAVVGSDVTPNTDMTVEIYGKTLHVQAVLDKTGTELDSALYVDIDTMKELIRAHNEKNPNQEKTIDPDNVVSSILIKVADGYDIDEVAGDINLHVRQVKAIRTQNMISGVSESLSGVSATISLLMVVVWILSVVILAIVFTMNINERKKEFAVLRVAGASGKMIVSAVSAEAAVISITGSVIGLVISLILTAPLSESIRNHFSLPFMQPDMMIMLFLSVGSVVMPFLIGVITAVLSAFRITGNESGLLLREDA